MDEGYSNIPLPQQVATGDNMYSEQLERPDKNIQFAGQNVYRGFLIGLLARWKWTDFQSTVKAVWRMGGFFKFLLWIISTTLKAVSQYFLICIVC